MGLYEIQGITVFLILGSYDPEAPNVCDKCYIINFNIKRITQTLKEL